jgi:formylglycine-generating enzyme required for sulfatase activity
MIHVPGGTFLMGSPAGEGKDDEHPQHQVTLFGYCIDRTEVTVADYARCVARHQCPAAEDPPKGGFIPCNGMRADRKDHPVNCVEWEEATAYCAFVHKRLPSEAEWEYAARGSDGRRYPWGNEAPDAKRLNACGSECIAAFRRAGVVWGKAGVENKPMYETSDGWEGTAPVGSFPGDTSPFGVLDMAGNVSEWTADWKQPYTAGPTTDPHSSEKDPVVHVIRGGSWQALDASSVRAADRNSTTFYVTAPGFRCARRD